MPMPPCRLRSAGFRAIYLSGAGVANAGFALPDLAMTGLGDVLEDTRRITGAVPLPLLVDADTGWGEGLTIGRTARELARAGAAAMHLEDQVQTKRCGHRGGKQLVAADLMQERIAAAVRRPARRAFRGDGAHRRAGGRGDLEPAVERCGRYVEAGADMIFFEGATALDQFGRVAEAARVPVLANITEFGKTPLWTREQLAAAGVALALYPLSGFRAMAQGGRPACSRPYAATVPRGRRSRRCRHVRSCTRRWITSATRRAPTRSWRRTNPAGGGTRG